MKKKKDKKQDGLERSRLGERMSSGGVTITHPDGTVIRKGKDGKLEVIDPPKEDKHKAE
jgi:hypothetical protein